MASAWFWMFTSCIGSVRNIPPPKEHFPTRKSPAPEIIEWTLRSELICLNEDWQTCEAALNRLLYYAPKDPYLLLRAAEHAVQMNAFSTGAQHLSKMIPIMIEQNQLNQSEIQMRITSIKEKLDK